MVRLRDGMWLPAENVRAEYAEEVYEITPLQGSTGLSLLCPAKKILGRGDALNLPTVTLVSRIAWFGELERALVAYTLYYV